MLETLKARKEALEARGESGFTLMEMLIVIAIIAILIAIAIPIMSDQLERANETADVANIRSTYATAMAVKATKTSDTTNGVNYSDDGTVTATVPQKLQSNGAFDKIGNLPDYLGVTTDTSAVKPGATATVHIAADGTCTVTFA